MVEEFFAAGAKCVAIAGAGHGVVLEAPGEVAEAATRYRERVASGIKPSGWER